MSRSILCALLVAGLVEASTGAQIARDQQPVFRSGVQVVQVDTVVTDARGRFVDDLTATDFEILEDGKPQTLQRLYLAVHALGTSPGGPLDKARDRPLPAGTPDVIRVPSAARVFVFVFDQEHLAVASFKRAQSTVESFLLKQFQAGDLGGLISSDSREGRLTSRGEEILTAVRRARARSDVQSRTFELRTWPRFATESEAVRVVAGDREVTRQVVERAALEEPGLCRADCEPDVLQKARRLSDEIRRSAQRTIQLLTSLLKGLSALDGRKTLIFFTDGLIIQESWADMRRLIGQAAVAGVTIYSVDARGLERSRSDALDAPSPEIMSSRVPLGAIDASQDAMNSLAVDTGGIVIRNRNMLAPALEKVALEAGTYYVIAYSPTNSQLDGSIRRIEVRVKRPGLTVRARRGYLATRTQPLIKAGFDRAPAAPPTDPALTASPLGLDEPTALVSPPLSPFDPTLLPPGESTSADRPQRLRPDARAHVEQLVSRASTAAIAPKPQASEDEILRQASLGWERYQAGDVQGARDLLKAAAADSSPPWVRYALGYAEYALSRPREAADAWQQVRRAAADFEPVYFDLVDAYIQLGDDGAALMVLRDAEERWPEDPEVFNALGVVQVRRGAIDDAIGSFRQATKVQPADATAYFNLAKAFEIRYQKRLRFSRLGQRWVANDNDLRAARDNYRQYLALGGPLEASARHALARLEWMK